MFLFKISPTPIDVLELKKGLASHEAGAFASFEGWVRNNNEGQNVIALEYEAYEPLCQKEADEIFKETKKRFGIIAVHAVHRVGKLEIGEMAIWIGVTAAHRDEAFKACRFVIDEIKARLPIWKKEHYASGSSGWVNCPTESSEKKDFGIKPPEGALISLQDKIATLRGDSSSRDDNRHDEMREFNFYSRQIILPNFGSEGQKKLKDSRVLIIGAGGLGCAVISTLVSAGVGTLGICEYDNLDITNLHRQFIYTYENVGESKVELAFRWIKSLNPYIHVVKIPSKMDINNIIDHVKSFDVILDCTDNFQTKFLINDACVLNQKPLITASVYQFEGYLRRVVPGITACLRCLWPQIPPKDCIGSCTETGILGVVPNVFGHWQALEALRILLNWSNPSQGQTILFDFMNFELQKIKDIRNTNCPICSSSATIKKLEYENYIAGENFILDFASLSPSQISEYQFIDIRELSERMADQLEGIPNIHLPLSQFPKSNFKFDADKKYLLFCSKGMRSLNLTRQLRDTGHTNIFSLKNGIEGTRAHG